MSQILDDLECEFRNVALILDVASDIASHIQLVGDAHEGHDRRVEEVQAILIVLHERMDALDKRYTAERPRGKAVPA
jgi:hypothetical protein